MWNKCNIQVMDKSVFMVPGEQQDSTIKNKEI
jgi:hypothetical protein